MRETTKENKEFVNYEWDADKKGTIRYEKVSLNNVSNMKI
jgi:hypothetical protein